MPIRFAHGRPLLAAVTTLLLGVGGCADSTAPQIEKDGPPRNASVGVQFNPQPEPPAQILMFQVSGDLFTRLEGRTGDDASLSISAIETTRRGSVFAVRQSWEVHPPDPIEPFEVQLTGIINTANGRVVLNGSTTTGIPAHVRGTADFSGSGVSIGGELMFNPQPEPPAR